MNSIEINFEITTESAFFIGSGLGITGLVDKSCIKDSEGFIYFPGSSIKGKVRYYCKQLTQLPYFRTTIPICETLTNPEICKSDNPCLICRLFGSIYTEGSLHFHDAILKEEFKVILERRNPLDIKYQTSLRTNNKINRYTKTAEAGHLFTTEVGERGFVFNCRIEGEVGGVVVDKVPIELALLLAGIRLINNLGGQKSRGLGNSNIIISAITIDGTRHSISDIYVELKEEWNSILKGEEI